ncbi:hypothetical protein KIN20_000052 [Parelaphostrongylus tenuis]|uniref:Uncharacterized protein n=1 Tax=Parelaphostrongylus tenuis TaxID=148309 RepID=A0AAD5MAS7_PARTN|nr:hypothetical protein KIN20_000052 [Parelaphostrongylus tenuis]
MAGVCSGQLFTWPVSSYSPYYERYFAAAPAPAPVAAGYPAIAQEAVSITPAFTSSYGAGLVFSAPTYAAAPIAAAPIAAATFAVPPVATAPGCPTSIVTCQSIS